MKRNYILIPIGGGGKKIELSPLTVTENGVYTAGEDKGYSEVSVSVADIPAVTEPLNITENGVYTPSSGVDGFSEVSVNVPTTDIENLTITENGTYSAPEGVSYGNIEVSVPKTETSVVSMVDSVTILGYTSSLANIYVASNKTISSCGVEVSETSNFAEVVSYTSANNSNGTKNVHITGLTPNTTYYFRSFVVVNGVNYNQEPFNTSTTMATPAVPENIPATATKMVTANTDVVNLKFKNKSPDEVVYIDWGDGAVNGSQITASRALDSESISHTYSETGVYDVYIWSESSTDTTYGKMPAFYANGSDMMIARIETPLQNIYNGSTKVTSNISSALHSAFRGCKSLEYVCPTLLENVHYYSGNGICSVGGSSYHSMFNNCTSLTTAPELPATTVGSYCYLNMFYGCTSLTSAPVLPATMLVDNCYYQMFYGCSNLQSVTTYVTTWNTSYTSNWLYNAGKNATSPTIYCPANSTLKNYTGNSSGIPSNWTQVDLPTE